MNAPVALAAPATILGGIEDSASLARELLDVLRRESSALSAMPLSPPTEFAQTMGRLVVAYRYKLTELKDAPMVPEAKAPLDELKNLNTEVMAAARTNSATLQGAIDGNRRFLEIVIAATTRPHPAGEISYGRVGDRAALPRRPLSRNPAPMPRRL